MFGEQKKKNGSETTWRRTNSSTHQLKISTDPKNLNHNLYKLGRKPLQISGLGKMKIKESCLLRLKYAFLITLRQNICIKILESEAETQSNQSNNTTKDKSRRIPMVKKWSKSRNLSTNRNKILRNTMRLSSGSRDSSTLK
jgi:hypothetical protein